MKEINNGKNSQVNETNSKEAELYSLEDFLVKVEPYKTVEIDSRGITLRPDEFGAVRAWELDLPVFKLFCSICEHSQPFYSDSSIWLNKNENNHFIEYKCKSCEVERKRYAITLGLIEKEKLLPALRAGHSNNSRPSSKEVIVRPRIMATKFGEVPQFGNRVPGKLLDIFEEEKDYFLKGITAENIGLGIGAATYYRRVIESKWRKLVLKLIQVAEEQGASKEQIEAIKKAQTETSFQRAVEDLEGFIPPSMLIRGRNPFTMLFSAYSKGLHVDSDQDNLDSARKIKLILVEFCKKYQAALKDEKELKEALRDL